MAKEVVPKYVIAKNVQGLEVSELSESQTLNSLHHPRQGLALAHQAQRAGLKLSA